MKKITSIHQMEISKKDRLLIVMPHPDDEAVFTSGLICQAIKCNIPTRVVILTCGEKSSWKFGLKPNQSLCEARYQEQKNAFSILSLLNYSILHFPDGTLENLSKKINQLLLNEIEQFKPSVIITLEPDGIYGHPDHIAVSQFCSRFLSKKIRLLYATVKPNFVFPKARWMSKKKHLHPITPEYELKISFKEIFIKFRTLCAHRSQFNYFLKWDTLKQFIINNMFIREYFTYLK